MEQCGSVSSVTQQHRVPFSLGSFLLISPLLFSSDQKSCYQPRHPLFVWNHKNDVAEGTKWGTVWWSGLFNTHQAMVRVCFFYLGYSLLFKTYYTTVKTPCCCPLLLATGLRKPLPNPIHRKDGFVCQTSFLQLDINVTHSKLFYVQKVMEEKMRDFMRSEE